MRALEPAHHILSLQTHRFLCYSISIWFAVALHSTCQRTAFYLPAHRILLASAPHSTCQRTAFYLSVQTAVQWRSQLTHRFVYLTRRRLRWRVNRYRVEPSCGLIDKGTCFRVNMSMVTLPLLPSLSMASSVRQALNVYAKAEPL